MLTHEENRLQEKLSELVRRFQSAFGDHFVSAILYGSAAMGDWRRAPTSMFYAFSTGFRVLSSPSPKPFSAGGGNKVIPHRCC
jgi:hypothetical protein